MWRLIVNGNIVCVTPIFGHGWARQSTPLPDVPPPFDLNVSDCVLNSESVQFILGKVLSEKHLLADEHVLLVHRGQWSQGHAFDLFARKSVYQIAEMDLRSKLPKADTIGFAMIDEEKLQHLANVK